MDPKPKGSFCRAHSLSVSQSVCCLYCRSDLPGQLTGRSPKLRKPPHSIVHAGQALLCATINRPHLLSVSLTKIGRNKVCTILRTNEQKEEN